MTLVCTFGTMRSNRRAHPPRTSPAHRLLNSCRGTGLISEPFSIFRIGAVRPVSGGVPRPDEKPELRARRLTSIPPN